MPRDLDKLLLDLVGDDPVRRERAALVIDGRHRKALGPRVTAAVARGDFPRRRFYLAGAELVVAAQKRWVGALGLTDNPNPPPDPRTVADPHRRQGLEWCDRIDAAVGRDPSQAPAFSCGGL